MSSVNDNIKKILKENKVDYEVIKHDYVRTAEEAAQERGMETPEKGIKSLIFKTKENSFILVLVPGNKRARTSKIARLEKTKRIFLASPKEVKEVSGVDVGAVAPFGLKTKLKTYIDEDILGKDVIYFSTGTHYETVKMKPQSLLKILKDPILF